MAPVHHHRPKAITDKQGNTEIFRSDFTDTITDTSYIIPTWDMTLTSKVT